MHENLINYYSCMILLSDSFVANSNPHPCDKHQLHLIVSRKIDRII